MSDTHPLVKRGFLLLLDEGGRIQEILTSPPSLPLRIQEPLAGFLSPEDQQPLLELLQDLSTSGSILHQGFTFLAEKDSHFLQVSALNLQEGRVFLAAFQNPQDLLSLYEKLVEQKSPYLSPLRSILLEHLTGEGSRQGEKDLYNQISGLNNHLINLQRELTKKNLSLKYYSEQADEANKKMRGALDQLEEEFEKGKRLHQRFFPSTFPQISGLRFSSFYQPVTGIGGDFFHIIPLQQEVLIYLADVSGHGLDGAMINIFLRGSINSFLLSRLKPERISPQRIITHVYQEYVEEDFPGDSFLCLLLGVLDLEKSTFTYANAGFQIPPFLLREGEVLTPINRGMPISQVIYQLLKNDGIFPFYREVTIPLRSPSTLLLCTDGLVEQKNKDQIFGKERIKNVLLQEGDADPEAVKESLLNQFHSFRGQEKIRDDITFLIVKKEQDTKGEFLNG